MMKFFPYATVAIGLAVALQSLTSNPSAASGDIQAGAVDFLADVMLIDAQCGNRNAAFGVAFRYAEEKGVHVTDIMPLGRRRGEFDAAYERRLRATRRDSLCGALAEDYIKSVPGLFTAR